MATLPNFPKPVSEPTNFAESSLDLAAVEIARLLEDHFDEQGWSDTERDRRVASSSDRINAAVRTARP